MGSTLPVWRRSFASSLVGRTSGSTLDPAPMKLTRHVWLSLLSRFTSCLKSSRMISLERCVGRSVLTATWSGAADGNGEGGGGEGSHSRIGWGTVARWGAVPKEHSPPRRFQRPRSCQVRPMLPGFVAITGASPVPSRLEGLYLVTLATERVYKRGRTHQAATWLVYPVNLRPGNAQAHVIRAVTSADRQVAKKELSPRINSQLRGGAALPPSASPPSSI